MPTPKAARERARQLREDLEQANHRYYVLDDPTISDAAYDRMMRELEEIEHAHPELRTPDSPTQRVGAPPRDDFAKVKHGTPMLSLANAHDTDEFREWMERVRRHLGDDAPESVPCVAEPKLDGISVSLTYENGILVQAATRGDGETGEDITENMRTVGGLPLRLREPFPDALTVRAEVYVRKKDFEEFNARREESERYVNPRNFAGGSLRQLDSTVTAQRPLRLAAYALARPEDEGIGRQHEALERLNAWGFRIEKEWIRLCGSAQEVEEHFARLVSARNEMPFEADGMVVKVDAIDLQRRLGFRSRSPRWAVAWKFAAQQEITTLREIAISVGRTGALTPVAVLDPVFVGGVTVTNASLHNQDEIERLDARPGDRVVVERAGDVIPKVVQVLVGERREALDPFEFPDACPICGTQAVREEDEVVSRCPNVLCPARVKATVLHFASQGALNIEGLGEKLVDQLVEKEIVRSPADLLELQVPTLAALDRMGEKSAQNLVDAIGRAKKTTLGRLLFGLGIRHVGEVVAETLARHAGSLENLIEEDQDSLEAIPEVGPIVAASVRRFLDEPRHRKLLEEILEAGVTYPPPEPPAREGEGPLAGLSVVVTGTLEGLNRKEAEALLKEAGARVSGSVSKKTAFVLAGKKAGSKREKAEALGVPVLDLQTVRDALEHGRNPAE